HLATRVWRDQAPGLGPAVAMTTTSPRDVLEPLARRPEPTPPQLGKLPPPPPPPPGPPWWKKTWVREVFVIGTILAAGAVITYAATRDPGTSSLSGIGFTSP